MTVHISPTPAARIAQFVKASVIAMVTLGSTVTVAAAANDCNEAQDSAGEDAATVAAVEAELESIWKKADLPALWAARYDADAPAGGGKAALRKREFVFGVRKAGSETVAQFNDIVHLGSCTKAMTALLVAQLVSTDPEFGWNTTLGEALPGHDALVSSAWANVKILDMLHHKSGFPANAPWQTLHNQLPDDIVAARVAVADWLAKQQPPKNPKFLYSNVNYALLGHILETKAGKPWEEIIKERLFDPLGIESAGFGPPGMADGASVTAQASLAVTQPWGHRIEPGVVNALSSLFGGGSSANLQPIRFDNARPLGPAGRVHMTVTDWAKFLQLFLQEDAPDKIAGLTDADWRVLREPSSDGSYAGGWIVAERGWAGGNALSHSGSNTMWHCVTWIAPERDFFVLAVTNCHKANVSEALDKTVSELIRRF